MPPFCADEPRFYSKCGTKPTYTTAPNAHVLAIASSLILVIVSIVVTWYALKFFMKCFRHIRNRATSELVAMNPIVEYQTVYVPPATDNTFGEAQSSADDLPTYESLFKTL